MPNTLFARCLWTVICFAIALQSAWASEGFWLLNRLPLDAIENDTGIRLESNWISRALRSTLRTPGWRTSSFISPAGLVLTNHHCLVACLSQNSASHNYTSLQRD
jgi:hypothetical protein